jgi:DNA modification methylase
MQYLNLDSFDALKTCKDNSFDMILTDPPYNFTDKEKEYLHKEFLRICSGVIIVFAPPENQWILPADQYLFWIKPTSTKNTSKNYSRFVEMMFVYGRNKWNSDGHWSKYTNVFTDLVDTSSVHPFRKPLSLLERLIQIHTDVGDRVLDPFAGSASIGEVCDRFSRDYVGFEKDLEMYTKTVERLRYGK